MPGEWRFVALFALLLGVAGLLPATASMPFNPVLDVFVSSPALSGNSNVRISTSVPSGNHALGTASLTMPVGWNVSGDSAVPNGDLVGRGVMSVDTDCDGSVQNYGPFNIADAAVDPGGDAPVARWVGQITSWWNFVIIVDQLPGEPFDLSIDLTNFNEFHPLCAPQSLIVTVFGRSSPSNSVILTNPSSAGSKVWSANYASFGGEHIANVSDSLCIGTACDTDGDTVSDVSDNCLAWPNQPQNLPPWPVPANDPDCDGFSSAVEDPAGTNPLVHCGFNAWPADLNNDTFSDGTDITIIAGSFGKALPPAPARHNIAPDPVDGFVDGTDITKVAGFFAKSCTPCASDLDCDALSDALDNCPNWPNPAQNLPPWPIPANDPDCDGFSSAVETSAGTNAAAHCGNDAWPADLNNDSFSDGTDITIIAGSFGKAVPPAPARNNIAPDPVDGFVDGTDITRVAGFFGKACS